MVTPTQIVRPDEMDTRQEPGSKPAPTPVAVDAAHATTGWSAYDVWRSRVFVSPPESDAKVP